MDNEQMMVVLKAIADDTRMNIMRTLLRHNCCVGALARMLQLSEAAVSQHLKVLREAGLLTNERSGYFMHYYVNREVLSALACQLDAFSAIQSQPCNPEQMDCSQSRQRRCHDHKNGNHGLGHGGCRHAQSIGQEQQQEFHHHGCRGSQSEED